MANGDLRQRIEAAFTPPQVAALEDWLEAHQRSLVKAGDFNELKEIVRDLAEAQQRTETRVGELVAAQQRTETRMEELATTQATMQQSLIEMQGAIAQLARGLDETRAQTAFKFDEMRAEMTRGFDELRSQTGASAQTLGYLLENEAYRNLPAWLKEHRGIEVLGRIIRQQVGDEEINLLVEARQGAEEVIIVGEAKGRVHLSDLGVLAGKVEAVQEAYPNLGARRIVPLLVAHFAPEKVRQRAEKEGVIVVQSFEW